MHPRFVSKRELTLNINPPLPYHLPPSDGETRRGPPVEFLSLNILTGTRIILKRIRSPG